MAHLAKVEGPLSRPSPKQPANAQAHPPNTAVAAGTTKQISSELSKQNDNDRMDENDQVKKVSPSPLRAKIPSLPSHLAEPKVLAPQSQLKSPPELQVQVQVQSDHICSSAHEHSSMSTSHGNSPSAANESSSPLSSVQSPPTSPQEQSLSHHNADSIIDALKKQANSPHRSKKTNDQQMAQKQTKSPAYRTNSPDVPSNLEESYFRTSKPAPIHTQNGASSSSSSSAKPDSLSEKRKLSTSVDGDGSITGLPPTARESEHDESCSSSQATERHSDRTNIIKDKSYNDSSYGAAHDHKRKAATNYASPAKKKKDSLGGSGGSKRRSNKRNGSAAIAVDSETPKTEEDYQAMLKRVMAESLKPQPSPYAKAMQSTARKNEVIDLLDSDDDDEEDAKLPAKTKGGIKSEPKPSKETSSLAIASSTQRKEEEEDDLAKAIQLSEEEAEKVKQRVNDKQYYDDDIPQWRTLGRTEFQEAIDAFIKKNGGYEKIEKGELIAHGNSNDMKKDRIVKGGGQNQTGAQYGRYGIESMWRVFDVLEGKADVKFGSSLDCKAAASDSSNDAQNNEGDDDSEQDGNSIIRLDGLPGAQVKAFVDIGHGIGIQCLQAGWALGKPSRGVEIMLDRHEISEVIQNGVLESLRSDPPDNSLIELKKADFSVAVVADETTGIRDEGLRRFLLFQDKSKDVQKGMVIFANNARDVFGARSNQGKKAGFLDTYLANLFANMQVGGRMVTLTDISCHLPNNNGPNNNGWFR